jgi:glycine betaine/choline ABC-type transport system substrate-binding protein
VLEANGIKTENKVRLGNTKIVPRALTVPRSNALAAFSAARS